MANGIESIPLDGTAQLSKYNVTFYNYKLNSSPVDYEHLAVTISKQRASAVEREVTPLAALMRKRNIVLEDLGNALAFCSSYQAMFNEDSKGGEVTGFGQECYDLCVKHGITPGAYPLAGVGHVITKSNLERLVQVLKTKIDALNNDAQTDMTSLQSLVDRRDQAYTTATELMNKISDTRGTAIKNV